MFISILIVAVVATLTYSKYKHLPIRYILHLSWITALCEIAAIWMIPRYESNHFVYNVYLFFLLLILFKLVYDHIEKSKLKKVTLGIACAVLIAYVSRAFFVPILKEFFVYIHAIGMIAMVIVLLLYAVDLLQDDISIILKERLELFVFSGYLLFGIGFIPLSFFAFTEDSLKNTSIIEVFKVVQTLLLLMMNGILCFGFIWTKPQPLEIKKK